MHEGGAVKQLNRRGGGVCHSGVVFAAGCRHGVAEA